MNSNRKLTIAVTSLNNTDNPGPGIHVNRALKYFDKVVNMWPFDYDGLIMMGWTYFRLNSLCQAKVVFQKALPHTHEDKSALEGLNLIN
jgi:hypothetical protein